MTYQQKNKLKAAALSCWMACLFAGGILFGGADWIWPGIPWGPIVGVACFVALGGTVHIFKEMLP